jgi:large subunit ribosomal protein L29
MKATDIRNMTKDEIIRHISDLRDEHFKLRMRRSGEELPNPLRLRVLKRDIARLLTILKEYESKEAETSKAPSEEQTKKDK